MFTEGKEINFPVDKDTIIALGKGVYLIEEESGGETIYVVYLPGSDFGYLVTEPVYRFLYHCSKASLSTGSIIELLLDEFDVERQELEKDLAQCIAKCKRIGIITNDETLPQ